MTAYLILGLIGFTVMFFMLAFEYSHHIRSIKLPRFRRHKLTPNRATASKEGGNTPRLWQITAIACIFLALTFFIDILFTALLGIAVLLVMGVLAVKAP